MIDGGASRFFNAPFSGESVVHVSQKPFSAAGEEPRLPQRLALSQNFPNPFNPNTTIRYTIPVRASVTMEIIDTGGGHVRTLVAREQEAGLYSVVWDGTNDSGLPTSSGIYY